MLAPRDRELVVHLALKDFKIRYTSSVLGYAWSVLNPLVFTLIYFLVFSVFIRFDVPNYPGYLLLGIALWNFFAEGSQNGVTSLLARAGIIAKVKLPRQVVVYAAVLNASLTFAISLLILGGFLWWSGVRATWCWMLLPVLLANLVMLTLGVALFLAPLHVRYRDIGYLWSVGLQVLFWLTPIIYVDTMIPERWRWLITYNPMARIILYGRQIVITGTWPDLHGLSKTTLAVMAILLLGHLSFQRRQARIVEDF